MILLRGKVGRCQFCQKVIRKDDFLFFLFLLLLFYMDVNPQMESSWKEALADEFAKPYVKELKGFIVSEVKNGERVYPPLSCIFAAFDKTPFWNVRVVILGQDPYHGHGQAHGLCFSVPRGIAQPPSLVNIFKELHSDAGIPVPASGNLEKWAAQGVFLLNATLTVRAGVAGSHQKKGWEEFTDAAIRTLSDKREGLIFLLWGRYAQSKESLINTSKHTVFKAAHPSPLSAYAGFFGCKHFSKTNETLRNAGKKEIDWSLE